jgi:hypothetical protein
MPVDSQPETLVLSITPTAEVVNIDGVECRAWRATTLDGHRCMVFVHRIGTPGDSPINNRLAACLDEMSQPGTSDAMKCMRRSGM